VKVVLQNGNPWQASGYGPTLGYGPPPGYGPTLAAAVATHGPMPVRSVLTMAAVLAEALSAAHAADVIHPGLGPASVLLAPDGPRLIDSGIAQAAYRAQAQPARAVPGPLDFTPPERAAGLEAGPASDMFSLGAVLLYAATGAWISYFAWHLDQLPGELRPFIERCMAADPARRPTAAELRTELAAAHPESAGHAGWPAGIPATGTVPSGGWPAPGAGAAPAWTGTREPAPPKPRKPRDMRKIRRRAGIFSIAALAVAVALAGAVYIVHPWPYPVLQPTGLTADQRGATSVSLGWSNPASGPLPDKYVILRDGKVAATVPGNVNHFKYDGLAPMTTYDFRVIAYRGSDRSQPSPDLRAATRTPPLSDAVFESIYSVREKVESGGSSISGYADGDTWYDSWVFMSSCAVGPCTTRLTGTIDGHPFSATLKAAGNGSYTGSAPVNDAVYCGNDQTNYIDTTLDITVKPVAAKVSNGQWAATKLTGSADWTVSVSADGSCGGGTVATSVSG
jgi:Protein kinase domain/Fibronectin type III domain